MYNHFHCQICDKMTTAKGICEECSRKEECSNCKGKGKIFYIGRTTRDPDEWIICPDCKGFGKQ